MARVNRDYFVYEITRSHRQYALAAPLDPIGLGTGEVEAMSSYLCRLSEDSMEMLVNYSEKILKHADALEGIEVNRKYSTETLRPCNGIGKIAKRCIHAMNLITKSKIDTTYLTSMPLRWLSTTNARGLMKENRVWCTQCWNEDRIRGYRPYLRLAWLFQHSKVCTVHGSRLSEYCPACGDPQIQTPRLPRHWVCDTCGSDLCLPDATYAAENFSQKDEWVSHTIFCFIERIQKERLVIYQDSLQKALKRFLATHGLTTEQLAERLNVDDRILGRLVDKPARPLFPVVLDFCYRIDVPVDQFLFDRDNLTASEMWRNEATEQFFYSRRLTPPQKKRLAKELRSIVKENPMPPIRPSHFARKHNTTFSALNYNYPKEYELLRKRYTHWEKNSRRLGHLERVESLTEGVFGLVRQGIYPSDRRLRDLKLVLPSDLRREDVKVLLRTFQEIYSNLNVD